MGSPEKSSGKGERSGGSKPPEFSDGVRRASIEGETDRKPFHAGGRDALEGIQGDRGWGEPYRMAERGLLKNTRKDPRRGEPSSIADRDLLEGIQRDRGSGEPFRMVERDRRKPTEKDRREGDTETRSRTDEFLATHNRLLLAGLTTPELDSYARASARSGYLAVQDLRRSLKALAGASAVEENIINARIASCFAFIERSGAASEYGLPASHIIRTPSRVVDDHLASLEKQLRVASACGGPGLHERAAPILRLARGVLIAGAVGALTSLSRALAAGSLSALDIASPVVGDTVRHFIDEVRERMAGRGDLAKPLKSQLDCINEDINRLDGMLDVLPSVAGPVAMKRLDLECVTALGHIVQAQIIALSADWPAQLHARARLDTISIAVSAVHAAVTEAQYPRSGARALSMPNVSALRQDLSDAVIQAAKVRVPEPLAKRHVQTNRVATKPQVGL